MLIWLSLPFADSRRFVSGQLGMVKRPTWPKPAAGEEFVRGFGAVKERLLGGVSFWGEDLVCDLRRALLFPGLKSVRLTNGRSVPVELAFRRLYCDGLAVGKFEIAFATVGRNRKLVGTELQELLECLLKFAVTLPSVQDHGAKPLIDSGKALLTRYALATTRTAAKIDSIPGWALQLAAPLLFVQMGVQEQDGAPPFQGDGAIEVERFKLGLRFANFLHQGRRLRTWVMKTSAHSDKTVTRELRISLVRLHSEQQVLPKICRNIKEQRLSQTPESTELNLLKLYLHEATKRIANREKSAAKICSSNQVVEISRSLVDTMAPGERDSVLSLLKTAKASHNLIRKVADRTQMIQNQINNVFHQEAYVTEEKYIIHGGAGAVGPGARVESVTIHNNDAALKTVASQIDLNQLIAELSRLQPELVAKASEPEQFQSISAVVSAKKAAEDGKRVEALEYLKKAGSWVLKIAKDVGISVTSKLIEDSLNLG